MCLTDETRRITKYIISIFHLYIHIYILNINIIFVSFSHLKLYDIGTTLYDIIKYIRKYYNNLNNDCVEYHIQIIIKLNRYLKIYYFLQIPISTKIIDSFSTLSHRTRFISCHYA